jgi:tetratricopeptide (TPR) repeat protein
MEGSMALSRVFVSHSSADTEFARMLVNGLRAAGADVWYDEHNLGHGILFERIATEIVDRPIFLVVISQQALRSVWVRDECEWAYNLFRRRPTRVILPVTASALQSDDFDNIPFLEGFLRIEASGYQPFPPAEAVRLVIRALALDQTNGSTFASYFGDTERAEHFLVYGKALNAKRLYGEAKLFLLRAVELSPSSKGAWANLGYALDNLGELAEALNAYDQALKIDDQQAWIWYNKSFVLETLGSLQNALAAISKSLSLAPQDPSAWERKGDIEMKLNLEIDAQRSYDRARILSSNSRTVRDEGIER